MLHGFMQNYAGPKNMWKKIKQTGAGQRATVNQHPPVVCLLPTN
jgi:hypothetical protein